MKTIIIDQEILEFNIRIVTNRLTKVQAEIDWYRKELMGQGKPRLIKSLPNSHEKMKTEYQNLKEREAKYLNLLKTLKGE